MPDTNPNQTYTIKTDTAGRIGVYESGGAQVAVIDNDCLFFDTKADVCEVFGMVPAHSRTMADLGLDCTTIRAIHNSGNSVGSIR